VIDCQVTAPSGPIIVPPLAEKTSIWFSLVVPTYNESQNVETLVEQVAKALDAKFSGRYEIIIADDNSPDGTADVVKNVASRFTQVRLMVRTNERGIASAVARGWQRARGEVLGVIDGDLQHPVDVLPEILTKIESGDELVVASRYTKDGSVGKWGPSRLFVSRFSALLSHIVIPEATKQVSDPGSGCFAVRRSVIEGRLLDPTGIKTLIEVLVRGRASKVGEVPYTFRLRERGETKVSSKLFFEYLEHLIKLRLYLWSRTSEKTQRLES
jgi:dolichol-phosphate mannosyltransferase